MVRLWLAAASCAVFAACSETNYAADVEDRLWAWVREGGGVVSEAIGAAPLGNMRSVRALADIPAGQVICKIPKHLQLDPEVQRPKSKFFRAITGLKLSLYNVDFAMYILREVRRRAARKAVAEAESEKYDAMWDWLEFHLKAVGDYTEAWDDAEIEPLGPDHLREAKESKKNFVESRKLVEDYVAKACPTGAEISCVDVEGLGAVSAEDFLTAVRMTWSRRFDAGMIVPVASLLNHRPPSQATASFTVGRSSFTVRSIRAIKAGEEITITYGNWHNHQLLIEHAFTQPPLLEPNSYFFVDAETLKRDVLPELDFDKDNFVERIELSTPYLYTRGSDPWTREEPLASVTRLVGEGGLPALEKLVDFYTEAVAQNPLIAPFLENLHQNRAQNRTSRVWWAKGAEAEAADESSADALGSARKSHAARVVMSKYLCLVIYKEALLIEFGELDAAEAIVSAEELSGHLRELRATANDYAREYLHNSADIVRRAIAKAKWNNLPADHYKDAERFVKAMMKASGDL